MLERSMPVAAIISVWLRPSDPATACRMMYWRGVRADPAWRANTASARCPARCKRCNNDCSGEADAVGPCGMRVEAAKAAPLNGLMKDSEKVQQNDHEDRH